MSARERQSRRDAKRRKAKARAEHKAKYRTWLDRGKKPVRQRPTMATRDRAHSCWDAIHPTQAPIVKITPRDGGIAGSSIGASVATTLATCGLL